MTVLLVGYDRFELTGEVSLFPVPIIEFHLVTKLNHTRPLNSIGISP
jgi:hypothetical protein